MAHLLSQLKLITDSLICNSEKKSPLRRNGQVEKERRRGGGGEEGSGVLTVSSGMVGRQKLVSTPHTHTHPYPSFSRGIVVMVWRLKAEGGRARGMEDD